MQYTKFTFLLSVLLSASALAQSPVQLHVQTADSTSALLENVNNLSAGGINALYFKFGNMYSGAIKSMGNGFTEARLGFFTYAGQNATALQERLSILDNGKVGIGTTSPVTPLHVKSNELIVSRFERSPTGSYLATGLELVASPAENVVGFRNPANANSSFANTALAFGYPGILLMPSGNVEIFTPASFPVADFGAKLFVEGAEMSNGTAAFKGTTNVSHFNYSVSEDTYLRGGKNDSKVFINDASSGGVLISANGGFAGIGTASPFAKLHVKGSVGTWLQVIETTSNWWGTGESSISGSIPVLSYGFNGNIISYIRSDNGAYISLSDQSAKTNIAALGNTLRRAMQLRPVTYQMKTAPDAPLTIGFIAQEVQALFPEAVSEVKRPVLEGETPGSELLGINYDAFGVLAIKAIQEQQAMIEDLQKRLAQLEKLVAELQK